MHAQSGSLFNSWATYVSQALSYESELAASLIRHDGTLGAAREALVRSVLSRLVPSAYEIGWGQVADSEGGYSKQVDIIIARRDFPILRMADGSGIYLNEGVVATIEVKSELNSEKLWGALDNCTSVVDRVYKISAGSAAALRLRFGLPGDNRDIRPAHAFQNECFDASPRPATYVFGFVGYKSNVEALVSAVEAWANTAHPNGLRMRHVPSLILGEGCVAWRNQDPFKAETGNPHVDRAMCLAGPETHPIRFLVLHLLYTLHRSIPVPASSDGLVPSLGAYLSGMGGPTVTRSAFLIP